MWKQRSSVKWLGLVPESDKRYRRKNKKDRYSSVLRFGAVASCHKRSNTSLPIGGGCERYFESQSYNSVVLNDTRGFWHIGHV